ncbi:MAG: hypothetical protein JWP29_759 [Rhodoferax sp.]|nr:hypothetical protein [Rhodoferax sp.]
MSDTSSKAVVALENRVFREWLKLSPDHRTGIALRDFEDDLWGRSLRLGVSPFLHHQGVMRVIGNSLDPGAREAAINQAMQDGHDSLLDLAAADVETLRQLWRRYLSPRWAVLLGSLGQRRPIVRLPKAARRNRGY